LTIKAQHDPTSTQERMKAAPERAFAVATATTAVGIRSAVLIQVIDTLFDLRVNHAWTEPGKAAYKKRMGIDNTSQKYIQVPQSLK